MPGDSLTLRNQQVLYCRILEYCSFPKDEEAWNILKYDICQGSEFQINVIRINLPKYEVQTIFPSQGFPAKLKDTILIFFVEDNYADPLKCPRGGWLAPPLGIFEWAAEGLKQMEVWMWNRRVMESHGRWDLGIVTICCNAFFCILKVWVMRSVDKKCFLIFSVLVLMLVHFQNWIGRLALWLGFFLKSQSQSYIICLNIWQVMGLNTCKQTRSRSRKSVLEPTFALFLSKF